MATKDNEPLSPAKLDRIDEVILDVLSRDG